MTDEQSPDAPESSGSTEEPHDIPKDSVQEMGDALAAAVGKSIAERPYATLLLALGVGFLLGSAWRR